MDNAVKHSPPLGPNPRHRWHDPRRFGRPLCLVMLVFIASWAAAAPSNSFSNRLLAQDEPPSPVPATIDDGANEAPVASNENSPAAPPSGINFLTLLTLGGWFMIPLALLSIAVVAIVVERFIALRRERIFPPQLIHQLSELSHQPGGLDPRRAYEICQQFPSSASRVLRAMLIKVGRPQSEVEHAVTEASQREATRLSQLGSWLGLAASIAPLIGLLGTVWGITQAFYDTTQMAPGANRSEALAQGIYTALVTTLCGLLIAIPAAIFSHHFENRVLMLMNDIEEMIFNLLPQIERYEGKIRFAAPSDGDSHDSTPARRPRNATRQPLRQSAEKKPE